MSNEKLYLKERGLRYGCNDVGNSERFIVMHGVDLRYVPEASRDRRWVAWDGMRWNSSYAAPIQRAKLTARSIYDEAKECENTQGSLELSKWAHRSKFKNALRSMVELAASELSVGIEEFDTDPNTINCRDGIVDLRTGELAKHSPDQLVMKLADVSYTPQAKAPRWQAFLNDVFLGDKALIGYVQRALGYSLTGSTDEQVILIAYGLGANGKSTLFETILDILGDYGRAAEFGTFLNTDKKNVRVQEAVGKLKGTRFAVAAETDSNRNWDAALIKQLTGGDTLTGAKLHGDSFEFKPTHKLWFQCNHLPGFKDGSWGLQRRLVVIPFRARFRNGAVDPAIKDKLLAERDAIFAWLVEGARLYLKERLGQAPDVVTEATKEYVDDNNILGRFIADCLEPDAMGRIRSSDLYERYLRWCIENNEQPQDQKYFPRSMEERGIRKARLSGSFYFRGYKLREVAAIRDIVAKPAAVPYKAPYAEMDDYLRMTDEERDRYDERVQVYLGRPS